MHALEGMETLAADVDDSRREYERAVAELKATVAKYQDAFADMEKLRAAYARLQTTQST
jgi:exonuclease VII small subunit